MPPEASPGPWGFHWALAVHLEAQPVRLVMWLLLGEGGAVRESLGLSVSAPASVHTAPGQKLSSRIILWTRLGFSLPCPQGDLIADIFPVNRIDRVTGCEGICNGRASSAASAAAEKVARFPLAWQRTHVNSFNL